MGFMMINNLCFFGWIKSCEDIHEHEDNISAIGVTLMENLSQKDSNLLFNLIVLFFPYFDNILILIIVISGLNKVDLYHVLCLFIFVLFLVIPKYKRSLTIFVIVYGMFFIMAKFTYTLIKDDYDISEETVGLLDAIGIGTVYE